MPKSPNHKPLGLGVSGTTIYGFWEKFKPNDGVPILKTLPGGLDIAHAIGAQLSVHLLDAHSSRRVGSQWGGTARSLTWMGIASRK